MQLEVGKIIEFNYERLHANGLVLEVQYNSVTVLITHYHNPSDSEMRRGWLLRDNGSGYLMHKYPQYLDKYCWHVMKNAIIGKVSTSKGNQLPMGIF